MKLKKMRTKRYIFQIKGQSKSPEKKKKKKETEISDYLKIFQLMFINMLLKLKSRMEDHNENINK